jgi:hypothetical protein
MTEVETILTAIESGDDAAASKVLSRPGQRIIAIDFGEEQRILILAPKADHFLFIVVKV